MGISVEWEAFENGLACRIAADVPQETLDAIRLDFVAALNGMGLSQSLGVQVVPARWRRYGYMGRTIMIVRDPLPTALRSEQSILRKRLHRLVLLRLNG